MWLQAASLLSFKVMPSQLKIGDVDGWCHVVAIPCGKKELV